MRNEKEANPGPYEIDIVPNEFGGWYARVPDFPAIFTGGTSPDEAMGNALETVDLMIEELRERKMPVPAPKNLYNGHFNIRVPKELHRELARQAENEVVSLNALISYLLSRSVPSGLKIKPRKSQR